jgi:N12 class adenine-specific DNA methylase
MGSGLPYHPTARVFGFIAEEMAGNIRASHSSADSRKCAVLVTVLRNDTHKAATNRDSWNEYRLAARRIEDAAVCVTGSIARC